MKKAKRFLAWASLLVIAIALCASPAMAAENVKSSGKSIIYYSDGSYLISELVTSPVSVSRLTNMVTGSRVVTYYNADHDPLWDMTLTGTFSYNGSTAKAEEATYSYNIYSSAWSFKSANAYCTGNKAIVESVFVKAFFITRDAIVTLTCSPTGVLS